MAAEPLPRRRRDHDHGHPGGERAAADPLVAAFLRRTGRALERVARAMPRRRLAEAVGAESDAAVLYRTLLEPAAIVEGLVAGGDDAAGGDPLAAARLRGARMRRELLAAGGGALTAGRVAALLGISTQAVNKRRKAGALLGLDGTRFLYPAFQFTAGGVLPGLREALAALAAVEDPWTRANFLLTGDPRLGGRRPLDVLREGDVAAVEAAAAAYGRQIGA